MEKRKSFYVSPKNGLTWLVVLCMVCSAVARVLFGEKGIEVWSQIVLPIAATLLYALIALLNGKEQFYKTAIPVWMMAIYSGIWINQNVSNRLIVWLFWIALVFFASLYTDITSGHRKAGSFLLFPVVLIPLAGMMGYVILLMISDGNNNFADAVIMCAGVLALIYIILAAITASKCYVEVYKNCIEGRIPAKIPCFSR